MDNLTSSEQILTYSYLSRILVLTLSLAYKESRQKRFAECLCFCYCYCCFTCPLSKKYYLSHALSGMNVCHAAGAICFYFDVNDGLVTSNSRVTFIPPQRKLIKESRLKRLETEILEAGNKTQECKFFYVFISSFYLKSFGQTNLLVRRKTLKKTKYNLNHKPRSKVRLTNFPRKIRDFTSSLPCLCTSNPRLTIKLDNPTRNEQIGTRTYLSHIFIRLAVKTAILQYFIDTTAVRLHASGRTINGKSYH